MAAPNPPVVDDTAASVKKEIICAIDFGTSRSGYGYMRIGDANKSIFTETQWPHQPGWEQYCKTPTQILYDERKPIAWGFSAAKKLAELEEQAFNIGETLPPGKYSLLQYFKMGLTTQNGLVYSNSNRPFSAVDVITDYLKLLWESLRSKLIKALNKADVSISEIKWCLTIPAIWKDAQKASMRRAAFNAGLIEDEDVTEDHFMLVLEPEAAAAWCLEERKKLGQPLLEGESFLIVDAGGGTVDLTAHEMVGGKLKERTIGTGNAGGSSTINLAFLEYLKRVCNDNMNAIKERVPLAILKFMGDFEQQKCEVADYTALRNIIVPPELCAFFSSLPQKPAAYVSARKIFRLGALELKEVFSPVISDIEVLVHEQFVANKKPFDYIFLVGGLGSSKLLCKHLVEKFASGANPAENVRQIIQPAEPALAVVNGAVLMGGDPSLIRERKMRATYGVAATVEYQSGLHDYDKRITLKDKPGLWIDNVLDQFVYAGEDVPVDAVKRRTYKARAANQRSMSIAMYHSPLRKDIIYTDGGQALRLGEIIVDMPDTTGGINRTVEVNMFVGLSELKFTAIEGSTGKKYNAVLKYNSQLFEYTGPPPVNFHLIFINDVSGSMADENAKPSLPWMIHKNKVGALYESCYTFLQSRAGKPDIVSCIMYNHSAWPLFEHQPANPEALTNQMMTVPAGGFTSFVNGMGQLKALLSKVQKDYQPVAFFMTDGECGDNGASDVLREIMRDNEDNGFTLYTVLVGDGPSELLQQFAQIGKGQMFRSAINLEDMKKTYAALAALLE